MPINGSRSAASPGELNSCGCWLLSFPRGPRLYLRGPLSVRIWTAGTWNHGAPCHTALCWAMSTQAVILYQARTQPTRNPGWRRWLAHDNSWSLFRADSKGLFSKIFAGKSHFLTKAAMANSKATERRGAPVGRGCSLNEAHVAFGINGQDSTELSRDIISFFLLFLTETRHQADTVQVGALRYGHGSNEAKAG